jgi:toxin ParE1/3/4
VSAIAHLLPQAEADIDAQADYIAQNSPRAARRFYAAVRKSAEDLAVMPGLGSRCEFASPRAAELRMLPIPGFKNHLIFYRPVENGIEVIRVLHGARDLESLFE